eukprot:1173429-Alexandrium_andersonii.AAC.1
MSASLVGSEMCIRDRHSAPCLAQVPDLPTQSGTEGVRSREIVRSWGTGAVSYTHLTLPTICSV